MTKRELNPPPACPECEKLSAVADQHRAIVQFLEWLNDEGLGIGQWNESGVDLLEFTPCCRPVADLLNSHFGIDGSKLESERRALLDWMRENNEERSRDESQPSGR